MKKVLLSIFFVVGLAMSGICQNDPPVFDSNNPSPIPIDGGVSLLLAAGAAYGVKKVRDSRKAKKEETTEEN